MHLEPDRYGSTIPQELVLIIVIATAIIPPLILPIVKTIPSEELGAPNAHFKGSIVPVMLQGQSAGIAQPETNAPILCDCGCAHQERYQYEKFNSVAHVISVL